MRAPAALITILALGAGLATARPARTAAAGGPVLVHPGHGRPGRRPLPAQQGLLRGRRREARHVQPAGRAVRGPLRYVPSSSPPPPLPRLSTSRPTAAGAHSRAPPRHPRQRRRLGRLRAVLRLARRRVSRLPGQLDAVQVQAQRQGQGRFGLSRGWSPNPQPYPPFVPHPPPPTRALTRGPVPGFIDNGVDWGAFARCCDARGGGSSGCEPGLLDITCRPIGKQKANSGSRPG